MWEIWTKLVFLKFLCRKSQPYSESDRPSLPLQTVPKRDSPAPLEFWTPLPLFLFHRAACLWRLRFVPQFGEALLCPLDELSPASPPVYMETAALTPWFWNILLAANWLAFFTTQIFHLQNGVMLGMKFAVYKQVCCNQRYPISLLYSFWNGACINVPCVTVSFTPPSLPASLLRLHTSGAALVLALQSLWGQIFTN